MRPAVHWQANLLFHEHVKIVATLILTPYGPEPSIFGVYLVPSLDVLPQVVSYYFVEAVC